MYKISRNLMIVLLGILAGLGNAQSAGSITVNGRVLTQQQVESLASQHGIQVVAGSYWYDSKTGTWGNRCGPGRGILKAGLEIGGPLAADASCGDTGVFVNGRELHRQDLALFQSLAGYIAPGRYWMDAQWNAGFEGGPALVNYAVLAAAAQRSTAANPGGASNLQSGGDNFWSSGFSAGNSSADGSQGYVSVPGYGPVGYGF